VRAVRFHLTGGPEVLRLDDLPRPDPEPSEVRIAVRYAGVNFIDTYLRTGFYDPGPLPAVAGKEGAGVVDAVGAEVENVAPGDRIAFFGADGSYAESVTIPADRAMPVPDGLDDRLAAALPIQGMTAHYLTRTIRPVEPGDRILVHAAAGGVGGLAVQMATAAGGEVFGTCSSEQKAARIASLGGIPIRYDRVDFADEVLRRTGGEGVDLAIDGVGKTTFVDSVRATRVRGHVVLFGQASGEPDPIRPRALLGSRTLTTASLFDYVRSRDELLERADAVFSMARDGRLAVAIDRVLPLEQAAEAHRLIEGRATAGKVLLEI